MGGNCSSRGLCKGLELGSVGSMSHADCPEASDRLTRARGVVWQTFSLFGTGHQARVTPDEFKRGVVKTALDKEAGRDFYAEPSILGQITKLISDGATHYAMGRLHRPCLSMGIHSRCSRVW